MYIIYILSFIPSTVKSNFRCKPVQKLSKAIQKTCKTPQEKSNVAQSLSKAVPSRHFGKPWQFFSTPWLTLENIAQGHNDFLVTSIRTSGYHYAGSGGHRCRGRGKRRKPSPATRQETIFNALFILSIETLRQGFLLKALPNCMYAAVCFL